MRKVLLLLSLSMLLLTGCFEKKNGSDIKSDSDNLEITNFTEGTEGSSGTALGTSGDGTSGSAIIIESSTVIPIDKVVTINFSETIAEQTVNLSTIYIADNAGNPIPATLNVVDTQITIIPNDFLLHDSRYTIVVTTNLKDIRGRGLAGIFNYSFFTEPDIFPILLSLTPVNGSIATPTTDIMMTFSEDIAGNARIVVVDNTTNSSVEGTMTMVGNILRFVPANPLNHATNYRVMLEGNVEDLDANIYTGVTSWNFSTESAVVIPTPADSTSPSLVGLTPTDGAIDVNKSTVISITFDETISDNGVNLEVRDSTSGVLVTGTNSVTGDTLVFTPDNDLLDTTDYNVTVLGSVEDLSGNLYTGQSSWSFTVPDKTPPALLFLTPVDGAIDVNTSTVISMTFDENIVSVTMVVEVKESISGISVNGTIGVAGDTLSFTPNSDLLDGMEYNVSVQGSLEDVYSNVYTGVTTWSFRTEAAAIPPPPTDTTAPSLVTLTPADGAIDVNKSTIISITFDENISDNGVTLEVNETVSGVLVSGTSSVVGDTLIFTPDSDFLDGIEYDVTLLGSAEDIVGNPYTGQSSWNFTVAADVLEPVVAAFFPTDGAINVDINTTIYVTFDENITNGGNIIDVTDETLGTSVSGAEGVTGNTLWFIPDSDLIADHNYSVLIHGKTEDLAGNEYTGQTIWTFQTASLADITPPTLTLLTPMDGDINVSTTTTIAMEFSEEITNSGVTLKLLDNTLGANVAGSSGFSGNTLWFIPDNILVEEHNYTVAMQGPTFDLSDNEYIGQISWNFSVKPFAVSSVSRIGDVVSVVFSDKLDPLTVSEIDFEIDGGAITFNTFMHDESLGVVTFISDDPLGIGNVISVSGTIQDLNGDSVNDGVPVDYIFL